MVNWLTAFALTQLIETPIYCAAQRGRPWPKRLGVAFGATCLSHPIVWFLIPQLFEERWEVRLASETFAVASEAVWLHLLGVKRPFLWSLVANLASFGTGLGLRAMLNWPP